MLSDEEREEYEELKSLLYTGTISQYGKRKLIDIIEKQSKEIEDNKKYIDLHYVPYEQYTSKLNELNKKWEDKIKAKIEELEKQDRENRMSHNYLVIPVLQSLLEKE